MNPRIKICGIKKPEDAFCCEELGADAIGLVFYPPSPRNVSIDQAAEIASSLPPFLTAVGLFVDPDETLVQQVLQDVRIDCLQFHGVESNDFCKQFARKWYKAIRAKSGVDLAAEAEKYPDSSAILVDSFNPGVAGGTGETFVWNRLPDEFNKPLILAGGLNAQNVKSAIDKANPWAVDVSSGVESAPGVKDKKLIKEFVKAVKAND